MTMLLRVPISFLRRERPSLFETNSLSDQQGRKDRCAYKLGTKAKIKKTAPASGDPKIALPQWGGMGPHPKLPVTQKPVGRSTFPSGDLRSPPNEKPR